MKIILKIFGSIAGASWFFLALLTGWGSVIFQSSTSINLTMAAIFVAIAAFLLWRYMTVARVYQEFGDHKHIHRLVQCEVVTMALAIVVGVVCIFGALHRLFSEHMPIFG